MYRVPYISCNQAVNLSKAGVSCHGVVVKSEAELYSQRWVVWPWALAVHTVALRHLMDMAKHWPASGLDARSVFYLSGVIAMRVLGTPLFDSGPYRTTR